MKSSEIIKELSHLTVSHKSQFLKILLAEITVMNRCFWSDDSSNETDIINALKWSNELVHRLQKIQFNLEKFEDNESINSIFESIDFNRKQSKLLSEYLPSTIAHTYDRFIRKERLWDFELNIDSQNRYLRIWDKIPLEGNPKLRLENSDVLDLSCKPKLLSVGIGYSYANIELPKTYEVIFDTNDFERFWECKTIVIAAENYRKIHWDLWRGHHSRCFIEILGEIPDIFNELPIWGKGSKTHHGIGLCTKFDWNNIKKKNITSAETP